MDGRTLLRYLFHFIHIPLHDVPFALPFRLCPHVPGWYLLSRLIFREHNNGSPSIEEQHYSLSLIAVVSQSVAFRLSSHVADVHIKNISF